jgi:heme-degrading monooxygenase HmoA
MTPHGDNVMFAVIFEVQPKPGRFDDYLEQAKFLKPELEKIDGFVGNDRLASTRTQGRLLSLSIWRDEKAVVRWRTLGVHHDVQAKGRSDIFADYHLRVGEIFADTQTAPGKTLPQQRLDETEVGRAKVVTISELSPREGERPISADPSQDLGVPRTGTNGVIDQELFESIYHPGKQLLLAGWSDATAAQRWKPRTLAGGEVRHRAVRIIRDYGMFDRREAPQFYPDITPQDGARDVGATELGTAQARRAGAKAAS